MRFVLFSTAMLLFFHPQGRAQEIPQAATDSFGKKVTCDCDSLWNKKEVTDFVHLLEKATGNKKQVWPGYALHDATLVISSGQLNNGNYCLGLWKKGKNMSYARLSTTLKMLTPLYSYYLRYAVPDSLKANPYFTTAEAAPGFTRWMQEQKISSAVYMPVDFSKLPFKVPAMVKLQLAIHEAFHVEVMLKYWYTGKGQWPSWDHQPDRKAVQICYTYNDSGRVMVQHELSILAGMIEALLDGNHKKACENGRAYLAARNERYEKLYGINPGPAQNQEGDCRTTESFFELEEGLADYASWTLLYNRGMASREELLRRYRARQNDHFYLSGSMLMHAITLMSKDPVKRTIHKIIRSSGVKEGSLLTVFEQTLREYCSAQ